jgi:hypothetical protein
MSGQTEPENLAEAVEIERFLSGKSNGAALFQRLFGAVAAEPIPRRLLAAIGVFVAGKTPPVGDTPGP